MYKWQMIMYILDAYKRRGERQSALCEREKELCKMKKEEVKQEYENALDDELAIFNDFE